MRRQAWLLSFILVLSVSSKALAQLQCLANSGTVVSTSTTSTWNDDREVFNQRIDVQPLGVAYARTVEEVQALVKCARANGVKAVPRGGGHGYAGYAVQQGKLTIDVSNLTSVSVDSSAQIATFGSGLRLGQLFLQLYQEANSLFPAGLCPWVGTSGHLLGGGTGLNSRSYGLACDQIVGLTMVDYRGELIEANSTHNTDLLWASCGGGGGNLGIVTSYTVKLHSLQEVPVVTTIEIGWSGYDNAAQIFDVVQRWAPYADRRMSLQILIGFGGVSVNAQFQGNKTAAMAELETSSLLQIPGTWRDNIVERSWINATLLWAANTMGIPTTSINDLNMTNGLPAGVQNSFQAASSYNQEPMSLQGIQIMVDAINSLGPNVPAYAEHKMLLGAVSDIPANGTAFYWRNSIFETQWMYSWKTGNETAAASSWLNSTLSAMTPYLGQGAYINYPDPLLAATSAWPQKYYGNNLARYTAVKSQYDPENYYSNPLTVAPTSPAAVSRSTASVPDQTAEVSVGGGGGNNDSSQPQPSSVAPPTARSTPPSSLRPASAPGPARSLPVLPSPTKAVSG